MLTANLHNYAGAVFYRRMSFAQNNILMHFTVLSVRHLLNLLNAVKEEIIGNCCKV